MSRLWVGGVMLGMAASLAGCSSVGELASPPPTRSPTDPGATSSPSPSPSPNPSPSPTPAGGGVATPTAAAGQPGHLVGTITYSTQGEYEFHDTQYRAGSETTHATITVYMTATEDGEGGYEDLGSTFVVERFTHEERQLGDCLAIVETETAPDMHAFSEVFDGYENAISPLIVPEFDLVNIGVALTYPFKITKDECGFGPDLFPQHLSHDLFACDEDGFGLPGLPGSYTDVAGGPDLVEIECVSDVGTIIFPTQHVEAHGTLLLYDE